MSDPVSDPLGNARGAARGQGAGWTRVPRFAEAAVERARLTVVPRRPVTVSRTPFVALVAALLVSGVVGLLLFNTSMQQASFAATTMETRAEMLASKKQVLRMELAELRDPQRLAARAKKLGMVPAGGPAFLRLSDGEVLGSPTPAQAGDGIRITPLPPVKPKSLRPDPVIVRADRDRGGDRDAERGRGSDGGRETRGERAGNGAGDARASQPGERDAAGRNDRDRTSAGGER